MDYLTVKWLHILSSTILFGTGIGSAFYVLAASLARDVAVIEGVNKWVARADVVFTGVSGVFQPLSGLYLAHLAGYPLHSRWLMWSMGLYGVVALLWFAAVWLQFRLHRISLAARTAGQALPPAYWRTLAAWVGVGTPAFFALVGVFYLMVTKPS